MPSALCPLPSAQKPVIIFKKQYFSLIFLFYHFHSLSELLSLYIYNQETISPLLACFTLLQLSNNQVTTP